MLVSHAPLLIVTITADMSPLTRVMRRLASTCGLPVIKLSDTCKTFQQIHINLQIICLAYSLVDPRPTLQLKLLKPEFSPRNLRLRLIRRAEKLYEFHAAS
jgi:hypothetical protein